MKKMLLIFAISSFLFSANLFSQEMTVFELVDNLSVGLTPSPSGKWGVAIADIDCNGYPDLYQARSASPGFSRIYLNNGGLFTDITNQSPLQQIEEDTDEQETKTAVWIDFDNDGDKDLYFGTNKKMHLLENENNTFSDIAESVGMVGGVPGFVTEYEYANGAWGDFNQDGLLDVLVAQHNNVKPYIFVNQGGTFVDMQEEIGLEIDKGTCSYGVQWVDFDLDGDLDLAARNLIFQNDDGLFTEVSESLGFEPTDIQNCSWFDYDNDGDLDFFKTVSSATGASINELWENDNGHFIDVTSQVIGASMQDRYRGLAIGDFDNDGDQDIFININTNTADILLLNEQVEPGVPTFVDVAEFVGLTQIGDRKGGSFFDYDRDGFLDLYLTSPEHQHILYHNCALGGNHWVGFILEGTQSNRDAIGTLVKIYSEGKFQIRFTQAPTDYQNQDNPWVHFGLGQSTQIDSVVIHWPLGLKEVFTDIQADQYYEIKEGQTTGICADDEKNVPDNWELQQNYPNPFNPQTNITYQVASQAVVNVDVFNVNGRHVKTLVQGQKSPGRYNITWNGTASDGNYVQSGTYFCRIRSGYFSKTIKMVFIR